MLHVMYDMASHRIYVMAGMSENFFKMKHHLGSS